MAKHKRDDESPPLAEARIAHRAGTRGLLRRLAEALAVGMVAGVVFRSRVAAAIVPGIVVVIGAIRLFHWVLERDAVPERAPDVPLLEGGLSYSYRPRGPLSVFALAPFLRQRIVVTGTHVTVPKSRWSRAVVSLPLRDVHVRVWGAAGNPNVEISSVGEARDFGMSFLGEENFRELVRVLEVRSAAARDRG